MPDPESPEPEIRVRESEVMVQALIYCNLRDKYDHSRFKGVFARVEPK